MPQPSARERFIALLRTSVDQGSLVKLTLGKYRGSEVELRNVFVRPVNLKTGPHLSFVFRYATRDVTKNQIPSEAFATIESLLQRDFLDAHLFTPAQTAQLTSADDGSAKLHVKTASAAPTPAPSSHDKVRNYLISPDAPWLRELGITNDRGQPREAMAAKYRQINRFVELVSHLTDDTTLPADRPFRIVDMGCGKGYLTFAVAAFFGARAEVVGIESRGELVDLCNHVAKKENFANLRFTQGSIADLPTQEIDVLIALHACDTATDDALFKGITGNASLLIVSPCCQKELRTQLTAPGVLASSLKHGIFQERQAEFVTDALRAELLEWAGYRTKVFEFISTEHTAKNLMIAAVRERQRGDPVVAKRIQQMASFYGIRRQHLATELGVELKSDGMG